MFLVVPKGSVLGPLLFIIYISNFKVQLKSITVGTFAHDTKSNKEIRDQYDGQTTR